MKRFTKATPDGFNDSLFEEAAKRRDIESKLMEVFSREGYREIITPTIEYYDIFSFDTSYVPMIEMYKLTDLNGRLLALRPDITVPLARVAATHLKASQLPLKLCYNQNVFRITPSYSGQRDEIAQCGVELIGASGVKSDTEIISTAIKALRSFCGDAFRFEIGHINFMNSLIEKLNLSFNQKEEVYEFIRMKNYAPLMDSLSKLEDSVEVRGLMRLPRMFGGAEVLKEARKFCTNGETLETINYLENVYNHILELGLKENVMIDLGVAPENAYYTGIVFRGYQEGLGTPVLSGGRYDKLLREFGTDTPAMGFAIYIDEALKTSANRQPKRPIRIALTKGRLEKEAITLFDKMGLDAEALKNGGRKLVFQLSGIEVVLAKPADVITFVERGVCDIGIVGKDMIMEYGGLYYEVLDLGFGKCRFSVAAPKGTDFYAGCETKTVATKYTNVAKSFFAHKTMDVEIIKIDGSVELAPLIGLADAIVDLVETGKTLFENGLEVIDEIAPVSARLIVNTASMKINKSEIEVFLEKLELFVSKGE